MSRLYLVDAQLPQSLVERLTEAGHPAVHVASFGLVSSTDEDIWRKAVELGAAIISKDEDFVSLAMARQDGPAVVWLRCGNVRNQTLWGLLAPHLEEIASALVAGERVIEVLTNRS